MRPLLLLVASILLQNGDVLGFTASRRIILNDFSKAAGAMLIGFTAETTAANALDFDAFEKGEVERDTKQCNPKLDPKCIPELTHDEALCKYGVPGADERSAACRRVRDAGGALPGSKPAERSTQGPKQYF